MYIVHRILFQALSIDQDTLIENFALNDVIPGFECNSISGQHLFAYMKIHDNLVDTQTWFYLITPEFIPVKRNTFMYLSAVSTNDIIPVMK